MKEISKIDLITLLIIMAAVFVSLPATARTNNNAVSTLPKYAIHFVSEGENLHELAGYYLNSPRRWKEIYELNKEIIKAPNILKAGMKLTIPLADNWSPLFPFKEYLEKIRLTVAEKQQVISSQEENENVLETPQDPVKEPTELVECTDTDDGYEFFIKGDTCIGEKCQIDRCVSETRLLEYYCADNKIMEAINDCPKGCLEGACIKEQKRVKKEEKKSDENSQAVVNKDKIYKQGEQPISPKTDVTSNITTTPKPVVSKKRKITPKIARKQTPVKAEGVFLGLPLVGVVSMVIAIFVLVLLLVSGWKVFVKAGKPGWSFLVPFYNIYILLNLTEKPVWWLVLFIIPLVNSIACLLVMIELAKRFGKSALFGVGMLFLGFIFLPVLAFGSAEYRDDLEI